MDIILHYIEKGMGEPLILLHGNGEDGSYFTHQIIEFSKAYRVIAIDTRGHGKSPRGQAPFTIRQFAADLYAFMEQKQIHRAHLLGFSDGGNVAMIFAMNHPERVKSLIVNGANLNASGVKRSVQLPITIGYYMAKLLRQVNKRAKQNYELLGLMVNDPNILPQELQKISVNTLVIAGNKDMILQKHTELIYQRLPNAQLAILEGDHFVARKNPVAFNERVAAFLKENADE